MIRRPPRSTLSSSSAASDVYKRQVRSFGEFALITRNNFHDCTDKFLCSPYWGPVAVMLMVSNQEVSHNIFEHYYKVGGAWGADGGAIEIDDTNPKKNINIHHNKAYDTQGFIETDGGGPFDSVTVAYNEANVYEKFIGMTKGTNWFVYNNTIPVSYTHLRAHETRHDLVCRL